MDWKDAARGRQTEPFLVKRPRKPSQARASRKVCACEFVAFPRHYYEVPVFRLLRDLASAINVRPPSMLGESQWTGRL